MKMFAVKINHYNKLNRNAFLLLLNSEFRKAKYKIKYLAKRTDMLCEDYEGIRQKRGIKKLRALQKREREEGFSEKDVEWFDLLDYTKNGNVRKTLKNTATILMNDPKLSAIVYNEQYGKIWLSGETPWSSFEKEFIDTDFVGLKHYFSKFYNLECSNKLYDAVLYVSKKRGFKPIKDFLAKLPARDADKITKEDIERSWTEEKKNLC